MQICKSFSPPFPVNKFETLYYNEVVAADPNPNHVIGQTLPPNNKSKTTGNLYIKHEMLISDHERTSVSQNPNQ